LSPLNLKTTALSELFGLTIISPALAKSTVMSNETTMAVSDFIFAPAYRIQSRSRCTKKLQAYPPLCIDLDQRLGDPLLSPLSSPNFGIPRVRRHG
jgi:hypothetical protein